MLVLFLFIFLCLFVFYFLRNPTEALLPYNILIENLYEKKVFYTEEEKREVFPTSILIEKEWRNIRRECLDVLRENLDLGNVGQKYIREKDEFWSGWTTYEFRMFGQDNVEHLDRCPTVKKILADPNIPTAFFSIMEPGKTLSSHYGPFKGILRYHLGLVIPSDGPCFMSVDGETYDWVEGEGILFDETYKHFVHNKTDNYRVILFLDVKRPLNYPLNKVNDFILYLMGLYKF